MQITKIAGKVWIIFVASLFIMACTKPSTSFGQSQETVIKNVTLVHVGAERLHPNQDIIIRDGTVIDMRPTGSGFPAGALEIEGTGKFVTPGLIDAHTHLGSTTSLPHYLLYGVTMVRSMHGTAGGVLNWREAIKNGNLIGPKIITATPFFWQNPGPFYHVEGTDNARQAVRDMVAEGYDLIKIFQVKEDDFFVILEEASKLNVRVAGHWPNASLSLEQITEAGYHSFEHLMELYGMTIEQPENPAQAMAGVAETLRKNSVSVTPMLGSPRLLEELGKKVALNEKEILLELTRHLGEDRAEQLIEGAKSGETSPMAAMMPEISAVLDFLAHLQKAGVNIVVGTDSHRGNILAGASLHDELSIYSDAGISNWEILKMATLNGAALMDIEGVTGEVLPGNRANLLLLSGNPIQDLAFLRNPEIVFVNKRIFSRTELLELSGEIYSPAAP